MPQASENWLIACMVTAAAAAVIGWHLAVRRWRTLRRRRRAARARRGELAARALLERRGFEVISEQAPGLFEYQCDGQTAAAALRADYLVRRRGKRYVAEVKTGKLVTSLEHAPTRRQLLEYQIAYASEGVLLVDVEQGKLELVRFETHARRARGLVVPLLMGALGGAALTAWLAYTLGLRPLP